MGVIDDALDSAKRNIFDIENRTDMSVEEKVERIINIFAATCAGVAVQPIPFADIFVLTPIQAYMGTRLAAVRGVSVAGDGAALVREIGGVVGLGLVAQQLIVGVYKTILPFLGAITTVPLVFGATYAMGHVMDAYFKAKAEKRTLEPDELKRLWASFKKRGETLGKQWRQNR